MADRKQIHSIALLTALFSLIATASAQESRYQVGLRGNVLLGDGVPANDILGFGVIGRYALHDGWFAGAALDFYDYDFERTSDVVGILQDPAVKAIDAAASNTVLSGFFGRRYGESQRGFDWFWTAGLGIGFPDVDDIGGPTALGGTFDLTTDAGTEFHLMGTLGTSYHLTPTWSATFAARLEHQFMDILVTDRVTGATGKVDSQSPVGAYLSINYEF